jgi:ribonucleoside-diphosphate reductase alpha chain
MTDDKDIRMAQSMMDYIFRRLALDYMPFEQRAGLGLYTSAEREQALNNGGEYAPVAGDSPKAVAAPVAAPVVAMSEPVANTKVAEVPAKAVNTVDVSVTKTIGSSSDLLESMGIKSDAPLCMTCGVKMRMSGACFVCEGCGNTSGCS